MITKLNELLVSDMTRADNHIEALEQELTWITTTPARKAEITAEIAEWNALKLLAQTQYSILGDD